MHHEKISPNSNEKKKNNTKENELDFNLRVFYEIFINFVLNSSLFEIIYQTRHVKRKISICFAFSFSFEFLKITSS